MATTWRVSNLGGTFRGDQIGFTHYHHIMQTLRFDINLPAQASRRRKHRDQDASHNNFLGDRPPKGVRGNDCRGLTSRERWIRGCCRGREIVDCWFLRLALTSLKFEEKED